MTPMEARKLVSYLTYKSQQVWKDALVFQYAHPSSPGNAEGLFKLERKEETIILGESFREALHAVQGLVRAERERCRLTQGESK